MNQEKALSNLAAKLRVLRPQEKNKYLHELDEYVEDYQLNEKRHHQDIFLPHRIASDLYYSLTRKPFTQPEFASQTTEKDVSARKEFNSLFAGILAYRDTSEVQRTKFKKSVLRIPNPFSKLVYLVKTYQNGLG